MRCSRAWNAGQGYVERLWWYPSPPAGRREGKAADGEPMSALPGESLELPQGPRPRARFQRLRVLTAPPLVQQSSRDAPPVSGCETSDGRASGQPQSVLPGWSGAGRAAHAPPRPATSLPPTTTVRRPTEGRSPCRGFLPPLADRRLALAAVGP